MKKFYYLFKFIFLYAAVLQISSCENLLDSGYTVVMPAVPEQWTDLLGQPHWRVQWLDSAGQIQKTDVSPGEALTINLPVTWINPVTAWPWWPRIRDSQTINPENGLIPGLFKPAGGFFPFEASGGRLYLSWEAGHETVFYWELARANQSDSAKLPAYFDWLRFRELFTTGVLSEAVCKDPWLVDWQDVAERTISSNFDRRRLVPEKTESLAVPAGAGSWYGSSPFAEPLVFKEEETPSFPIRSGVNVWISSENILRINGSSWILTDIRRQNMN